MSGIADLYDVELDAERVRPDPEVDEILKGAVDLHIHPAPSPFPRRIGILEAAQDAEAAGFRAIVVKSHHHSMQTDVLALRPHGLDDLEVQVYGGIALNNTVGGVNPYAVELALGLGGKVVWFPTISSPAHIEHHRHHADSGFPSADIGLRRDEELRIADDRGVLVPEAQDVLDVIRDRGAILNCGHLPPDDIDILIDAANERGIEKIVVSHPWFIIGADPDRVASWARKGAFIEHCLATMLLGPDKDEPIRSVRALTGVGPERTIFSSDLGQRGTPLPVTGFRAIVRALLDDGYAPKDVHAMVATNAASLLELP